ncbi:hypothetical protein DACRYDRAFT_52508 [Dacryopinax primogenitus]|uniref:t-SNARE coiled-coil homology domain-containing protein n=1 Tax=Dacryopinax primogenitus (strain DJM 731) TaxID=1858805 RepID=M5G0T9_DACPD|nr:uncharacterized protein DACRYDRAFT_52508 [Dacryopinax primogenitus]EJU01740.1 hypothetical protein DACRYDRAFT_52508 [Dacryopinax primogenitus]
MSWFKRDKTVIPPVTDNSHDYNSRFDRNTGGTQPAPNQSDPRQNYYRPSNATYNASRDRDLYSTPAAPPPSNDPYARRQIGLDPYKLKGRHPGGVDQDRAELFDGYDPKAQAARERNRFRDITSGDDDITAGDEQTQTQMDSEEEVEAIKKDIRWTKQETVGSSRNALRLAREAEETARNTLLKLGDQSGMWPWSKLADTERHLDIAKAHTNRAEDATNELKQLNRSIFRPVITWDKKGKRAAEQARMEARHDDERSEREKAMADVRETQNRIGKASTYGMSTEDEIQRKANRIRGEGRKRYQFEATESDDELEDELDDNLGEIGEVAKRLKAIAMAQGEEIDDQIIRVKNLEDKTGSLTGKIDRGTDRLKRIK